MLKSATRYLIALLSVLLPVAGSAAGQPGVHHSLDVTLDPAGGSLIVADEVRFSNGPQEQLLFNLNAGLTISTAEGTLEKLARENKPGHQLYRITLDEPRDRISLELRGKPLTPPYRGMDGMPAAILGAGGVYLDAGSAWYPDFGGIIEGFEMTVSLPDSWQSISQGRRSLSSGRQHWSSRTPEQEIYLIAGPYHRYAQTHGDTGLSVYLLAPDEALAATYLRTMGGYVDRYSRLLGDYPFPKFAVVENRWQTGYGMPSFTLLGSRVMRLPFIPYTSLPHEILHNWWGNGVWVDYGRGNWSEGLTAYLSDHLMKELAGEDDDYRRKALERYGDFAAEKRDFPLIDFVSRHSDETQAVGYSKALMLFHMLRRELGDARFTAALRLLWEERRFRETGFADVLALFERAAERPLPHARQWLEREGAPSLVLEETRVEQEGGGYRLRFTLRQRQEGAAFELSLPVAVMLAGHEEAVMLDVRLNGRETRVELDLAAAPLRLDIDPAYDALRLLDASERPATLSQLFGSQRWFIVLPSQAAAADRNAWAQLAATWQQRYPDLEITDDSDPAALPDDAALLIAGWSNRLLQTGRANMPVPALTDDGRIRIGGETYDKSVNSVVLMGESSGNPVGFIGAATADVIPLLARKLPHYGSYGTLLFDEQGNNHLKQSAPVEQSILTAYFSPARVELKLPARQRLVDEASGNRRQQ